jgi:hypothetical protein
MDWYKIHLLEIKTTDLLYNTAIELTVFHKFVYYIDCCLSCPPIMVTKIACYDSNDLEG